MATRVAIRGAIAPFLAVGLYAWLDARDAAALTFAACFAVNVVGVLGFAWQWRGMRALAAVAPRGGRSKQAADAAEPLGPIRASIDRGD